MRTKWIQLDTNNNDGEFYEQRLYWLDQGPSCLDPARSPSLTQKATPSRNNPLLMDLPAILRSPLRHNQCISMSNKEFHW